MGRAEIILLISGEKTKKPEFKKHRRELKQQRLQLRFRREQEKTLMKEMSLFPEKPDITLPEEFRNLYLMLTFHQFLTIWFPSIWNIRFSAERWCPPDCNKMRRNSLQSIHQTSTFNTVKRNKSSWPE